MSQNPANPSPNSRYFRPGQYIFQDNEPSQSVFLIKKGTVSIRKPKKGGQVEIARVYANELIGELSFFDRSPRSAAAMALTEVEVMEIPFDSLNKIFAGVPPYFKTIMASMAERLRRADDAIRRLKTELVNDSVELSKEDFSAADALAAVETSEGHPGGEAASAGETAADAAPPPTGGDTDPAPGGEENG